MRYETRGREINQTAAVVIFTKCKQTNAQLFRSKVNMRIGLWYIKESYTNIRSTSLCLLWLAAGKSI